MNVVGIVPQILVVGLVLMYFGGIPPLTWAPILIFILIFFLAANSFDALWLCMTSEENDTGLRVVLTNPEIPATNKNEPQHFPEFGTATIQ